MMTRFNRRTFLRGILGGAAVSVALPRLNLFLNSNGTAYADGTLLPKRFGLYFWGNGVLPDRWVPTGAGEGDNWQLSDQLQALANIKAKIAVASGMRVMTGNDIAHLSGSCGILSGGPVLINGESTTFGGPSIDQFLAEHIGNETRFRSLEVGVQENVGGESFIGPNLKLPPESNPFNLYQRLFGEGFVEPGGEPIIDPKLPLRRSVLDGVMQESAALNMTLGHEDKVRMDQHFSSIRDLEQRLLRMQEAPPAPAACEKPMEPEAAYPPIDGRPQLSLIARVQADLLTMALACDQTRVFSLWFADSLNGLLFPNANAGHHRLTHDEPGEQPQVNNIVKYIISEFAYLLESLDSVAEGDGTLLDNSAVLATSDCAYGRQHLLEEYPIVVGGSAGGYFKQNYHYRSDAGEKLSNDSLAFAFQVVEQSRRRFALRYKPPQKGCFAQALVLKLMLHSSS